MDRTAVEIATFRAFNRFHTRLVGALSPNLHGSGLGLTEMRVLYELAHRDGVLASELARDLDIDPAYLSRMLKRFRDAGWLSRQRSPSDGRASRLQLAPAGHGVLAPLEAASRRQARALFARLPAEGRARLVEALVTAQDLLGASAAAASVPVIRPHRPGDMGWVVSAHGRLYAQEYGFDDSFEALVAEIVAGFLKDHDPSCERAFIAELDGEPVGSSLVVRQGEGVAKLRLVLLEPRARGLGLGRRLVREAVNFARAAGYGRMTLWTHDVLAAARGIYVAEGFSLVGSESNRAFGQDLTSEIWERPL